VVDLMFDAVLPWQGDRRSKLLAAEFFSSATGVCGDEERWND